MFKTENGSLERSTSLKGVEIDQQKDKNDDSSKKLKKIKKEKKFLFTVCRKVVHVLLRLYQCCKYYELTGHSFTEVRLKQSDEFKCQT